MHALALGLKHNGILAAGIRMRFNAASHADPDYQEVFKEVFPHDHYSTLSDKVTAHERWTTKSEDGEAVGISGVYALNAMPSSHWLDYFGIKTAFRGAGYGKQMLEHVLQVADRKEADTINLWTTTAELKTVGLERFYRGYGFEKVDCGAVIFNGSQVSVFSKTLRGHTPLMLQEMKIDDWLH